MRAAVIAALKADAGVAALVGARVYGREGFTGGISAELTPEAFTTDGDLLLSLVVFLEGRASLQGVAGQGHDYLPARQGIAVAALWQGPGYDPIRQAIRAVKRRLHLSQDARRAEPRLTPVVDPVRWTDTRWSEDTPEAVDPELSVPMVVARFAATIAENLNPTEED